MTLEERKKNEGLLAPFYRFSDVCKASPKGAKALLWLNFFLPGVGNLSLGAVESGLLTLAVTVGLYFLGVYTSKEVLSGLISVTSLTLVIVYLSLFLGLLALWYAAFSSFLKRLEKKERGEPYSRSVIVPFFKNIGLGIRSYFARFHKQYRKSGSKGKTLLILGFFLMGVPELFYKEVLRFLAFFGSEVFFFVYFVLRGGKDLNAFIHLDTDKPSTLVYGIVAAVLLVAFVALYIAHLKTLLRDIEIENAGKTPLDFVGECQDLANDHFYTLQLIVPIVGALVFTVIPLAFMIIIAFTNYSLKTVEGYANYDPSQNINIVWKGFEVFTRLFSDAANFQDLLSVYGWTIIWAVLATFTCYFGGLFLAMLLNKKCIFGKVVYRSLFVVSMGLPQFVSLLVMKAMFMNYGPINTLLIKLGWLSEYFDFWGTEWSAKVLIIFINMWVGIPYFMLLMSGLLLNIPQDLYEASDIEGASKWQKFHYITFPEIFYMTTPLLITSFVSNINNFNVIWFLDEGGTVNTISGTAGSTDILITWLYKLTMQSVKDYNLAAAIGILMFLLSASISLIVFQRSRAYQNEEEFR
jgi:arabinogalactan oligomer / maltooligosaccharide transport system permease protein